MTCFTQTTKMQNTVCPLLSFGAHFFPPEMKSRLDAVSGGGGAETDPECWREPLPSGQAPSLGCHPLHPGLGHPTRAPRGKPNMPSSTLSFILIKR